MHDDLEVQYGDDGDAGAVADGYFRAVALNHAGSTLHPVLTQSALDCPGAIDALIDGAEKLRIWLTRGASGSDYMLPLSKDEASDLVVLLDTAISSGQHTGRSAQTARELIQLLAEHAV